MDKVYELKAAEEGTETMTGNDTKEEHLEREEENNLHTIQEEVESNEESDDVNTDDDQSDIEEPPVVYSEEEIHNYARVIGIDLDTEPELLWIVSTCLKSPLSSGWQEWEDGNGGPMYTHTSTDDTPLYHPMRDYFCQVVSEEREEREKLKATAEGTETKTGNYTKEEHLEREEENNLYTIQEEVESQEESDDVNPDDQSDIEESPAVYSEEEIHNCAREIGIDPDTEPELLWIVSTCLEYPLASGWEQWEDGNGGLMYTHTSTGDTPLYHPMRDYFCQMVSEEREKLKATAEGTETKTGNDTKEEHLEREEGNNLHTIQEEVESQEESDDVNPDDQSDIEESPAVYSEEEIHNCAREIGIDPDTEPELLWIVSTCLEYPLASGWEQWEDGNGGLMYTHTSTGDTPLYHPMRDYFCQMVSEEREKLKATAEGTETKTGNDKKEEHLEREEGNNLHTIQEEVESQEQTDDINPDDQSDIEESPAVYSEEEIHNFAREIGIDPDTEPELLWIVSTCLKSPLASGWEQWLDGNGGLMYKHTSTGDTPLYHPMRDYFCQMVSEEREKLKATAEGTETKTGNDKKEEHLESEEGNNLHTIQEEVESQEESDDINPDDQSDIEESPAVYSEEEIHNCARDIGIDSDSEPELFFHLLFTHKEDKQEPPETPESKDLTSSDQEVGEEREYTSSDQEVGEEREHTSSDQEVGEGERECTSSEQEVGEEEEREHLEREESNDVNPNDQSVSKKENRMNTFREKLRRGEEEQSETMQREKDNRMNIFKKKLKSEEEEIKAHLVKDMKQRIENLKESMDQLAKKEDEKMTNQIEQNIQNFKHMLRIKEYEEECNLKKDNENRLRALQQSLLFKRTEVEARLNEESETMQKELIESVQQEMERKQHQLREESAVFLKEQGVTLEKEEAAEGHKVEAQRKQNMERLRNDMEEECQAQRKKLQGEMKELLVSLKQELTDTHQAMREEMQCDHGTKLKQLKEDHEREMNNIRQQCLDEVEVLRKNVVTAMQEDRKHLQASCAAQMEKLHLEFDAQMQKAQKTRSQKESELQDMVDQIALRIKALKIHETMLHTKEADLDGKMRKLEEEEDRDVSTHVRVCQALPQLIQERDNLKQTDEATLEESLRAERDKAVEENKRLKREREEALEENKRLKREREEALEENKRLKREREEALEENKRLKREREEALEENKRLKREREEALEENKRLKREREEALEEKRRTKKLHDREGLLLEDRCDLLSQIISVMEDGEGMNAYSRPEPERVPSCYKRDSPLLVEDMYSPPLSPEPQSLNSSDRSCISSHGTSIQMERQSTLQEDKTSSPESSDQEDEGTDKTIQELQEEVKRLLKQKQMFETENTGLQWTEE